MITKLTLRNFKSVGEQACDFTRFDLLVGRNNSGKSNVLPCPAGSCRPGSGSQEFSISMPDQSALVQAMARL